MLIESYSKVLKRRKISEDAKDFSVTASSTTSEDEAKGKTLEISQKVNYYSDRLAISGLNNLDFGCFGSVTKDIRDLMDLKARTWDQLFRNNPLFFQLFAIDEENLSKPVSKLTIEQARPNVFDLEDECVAIDVPLIILSGDKDEEETRPSSPLREVVLVQPSAGQSHTEDAVVCFSCKYKSCSFEFECRQASISHCVT